MRNCTLLIDKNDSTHTMLEFANVQELEQSQVLVQIDQFAITANNATYVALGNTLGYWKFFPALQGFGIMPAWGYGTVVESRHPEIKQGERIFGFLPTSRYCVITPSQVGPQGFVADRPQLSNEMALYNNYALVNRDPDDKPEYHELRSLFWPLWTTSYYITDCLVASNFFNGKQVLVTCASSKTGFCVASCFRILNINFPIVGLTSSKNKDFVTNLGLYDKVLTYDELQKLEKVDTVIVDFSGNSKLLESIEKAVNVVNTLLIGITQLSTEKDVAFGKSKGTVFFAPGWIQKRYAELGKNAVVEKQMKTWNQALNLLGNWLDVVKLNGPEKTEEIYIETSLGKANPQKGYVASML